MDLILRVPAKQSLHTFYIELIEALESRAETVSADASGLDISPQTARLWADKVRKHAGIN